MTAPALVAYAGDGPVGALYVDGVLDKVGSRPEIEARVAEIVGIEIRTGNDFLRGGPPTAAAPSLDAISAWLDAREGARETVVRKREEAAALLREAARLEATYR